MTRSTRRATGAFPLLLALLAPAVAHAQPIGVQVTFDSVTYTSRSAGFPAGGHVLTIDGNAREVRLSSDPTNPGGPVVAPLVAPLDPSEFDQLDRLIRQARLGSIPDPVAGPLPVGGGPFFSLRVAHGDGALAGATSGIAGQMGSYGGRLSPLLDALDAVATRVKSPPPAGPAVYSGTLIHSAGVAVLEVGGDRMFITPASVVRRLVPLHGARVELRGVRTGPRLHVSEIVNPVFGPIEGDLVLGVVPGASARLELRADMVLPGALQSLPVLGPIASLLRANVGSRLRGKGWTHMNGIGGGGQSVTITEVEAVARLTSWLKPANTVRVAAGRRVRLTATRGTGADREVYVVTSGGAGWARANRFLLGLPSAPVVVLEAPSTGDTAGTTGGLTGGLIDGIPGE